MNILILTIFGIRDGTKSRFFVQNSLQMQSFIEHSSNELRSERALVLQLLLNFALKNERFAPNLRHETNSIQGSKYYSLGQNFPRHKLADVMKHYELYCWLVSIDILTYQMSRSSTFIKYIFNSFFRELLLNKELNIYSIIV